MMIELTVEEKLQSQAIIDGYQPELEALRTAMAAARDNKEEWLSQQVKYQAAMDNMQEELDVFLDKIQRKRFEEIAQGGASAIINHAKEQLPVLLEDIHRITRRQYKETSADTLKNMGVGTLKGDKLILNANYATQALKTELYLHIEALKDNKDTLRELLEAIIEAVEVSDLTDNADITDGQQPLGIKRFRRNPLGDITSYGLMNDHVNSQLLQEGELFQQTINGQLTMLSRYNVPQGASAYVLVALSYEGVNYKLNRRLTAFDKQVYEAVATRFHYWQQDNPQKPLYITPQEVWRTMNGKASKDGRAKPSAAQVKRICDSLDKMRFTRFYMDISAEIEAFNLSIDDERITGGRIETYVLNSSKVEFTTDKGNTVQGYRIGEEPILYTYNKAKNHLLYVPYEMLDTSQFTSDSENVTEFKGYLLQQIQLMKNAAKGGKRFKRNSVILLETIYRDTGIQPPENRIEGKEFKTKQSQQAVVRRLRKADKEKIEGILDAWKAKGWITGYTPIEKGKQTRGYDIQI